MRADLHRIYDTIEPREAMSDEKKDDGVRLLVVDDNERNRDILSRQFRRRGFEVLLAEDGEQAVHVVETEPVDLVILDIMMPKVDGVEALRRLREKHSPAELPIIMATAKTDSEDIVQCAELGANDHVGKPFDIEVLVAKVKALLRLRAAVVRPAAGEPTLGELQAGSILAGKYRLVEEIGAGAFGTVYKAVHQELDHEVALKILQPKLTASEESLARFRREGVAACRVRHPNAVAVSDYGVTETGVAYLVMELLEGRELSEEIKAEVRLSPRRTNEILQPVCEVLAQAHAAGLVHRDIKPENIFLHQTSRGEVVKVLDFGIAKQVGEAAMQDNLTAEGWIIGTYTYMAPERFSGESYDGRADVYSLGVLLFKLLTGRAPFHALLGEPMTLVRQHLDVPAPTLRSVCPDLPAELEEPVAWALKKDPAERPDAVALARAFAEAVEEGEWSELDAAASPRKAGPEGSTEEATVATTVESGAGRKKGGLKGLLGKLK